MCAHGMELVPACGAGRAAPGTCAAPQGRARREEVALGTSHNVSWVLKVGGLCGRSLNKTFYNLPNAVLLKYIHISVYRKENTGICTWDLRSPWFF